MSHLYGIANRLKKMGFSKPDPTINKKGVINMSGAFTDRQARGLRKLVVIPDDKTFKGVSRIDIRLRGRHPDEDGGRRRHICTGGGRYSGINRLVAQIIVGCWIVY